MNTFKPLGSFISIAIDEWSDLNKLVFYLWKNKILYWHWVRVIIFPSHTTHVLQPFDVSLASPLQASIKLIGRSFPAHNEKNILFVRYLKCAGTNENGTNETQNFKLNVK